MYSRLAGLVTSVLVLTTPAFTAALRQCWLGYNLSYNICCRDPPWTHGSPWSWNCWADDDTDPEYAGGQRFTYDRCCNIVYGMGVRFLPDFRSSLLHLLYPHWQVQLSPVAVAVRQGSDRLRLNESCDHKTGVHCDSGVLWSDRGARVLTSTPIAHDFRERLGRPTALLDVGSGLGAAAIAAVLAGAVDIAVGIDRNPPQVARARHNARRNGAAGRAVFVQCDICGPAGGFQQALRDQGVPPGLQFDVVTMDSFTVAQAVVPTCMCAAVLRVVADSFLFVDTDTSYQVALRRGFRYQSFMDCAHRAGMVVIAQWSVDMASLHGTDEDMLPATVYSLLRPSAALALAAASRP